MKKALQTAHLLLQSGQRLRLVTVVDANGSTPGRPGASMVVGTQGLITGTIGGGLIEHQCIQQAVTLLGTSDTLCQTFVLDNQKAGGMGMICGGRTRVLFTDITLELIALATQGDTLYLPLGDGIPKLGTGVGKPQVVEDTWLAIPLQSQGRIFLMGGGHVALATANLLTQLDYPYVVVDDRDEFANPQRFPYAQQTIVSPFDQLHQVLVGTLAPTAQDAMCMLTRGHMGDMQAVRFALTTPLGYIGVMGSRSKATKLFATLEQEGFAQAKERIVTPIGLAIGASTPAELAVSIAGQLIHWRSQSRS